MVKYSEGSNEHNRRYYGDKVLSTKQQDALRAALHELSDLDSFSVGNQGADVTKKESASWNTLDSRIKNALR